ncbi:hypothetical protein G7Y89_g11903 [Cudoniella acicularis]|uniref:alpha-galactosidase n=1 Tax=Cudoniella acicularis TaxID=354080 RepID=A0A8H4RDN4_9HELO|nr:hypothetical protein G7Y89_g11903 [Cudoniella acicularis]
MPRFHFNMLSLLLLVCSLATTSLGAGADFSQVLGQRWQIILSGAPNTDNTLTPDVPVWDIDLEYAAKNDIANIKATGKLVICYFSAGTVEKGRTDENKFKPADVGKVYPEWPDEHWLNIRSKDVRSVMKTRIESAAAKGCDAIDPDNIDGFNNDNGFNLVADDAVDYFKYLATTAAANGVQIGLKNAVTILPRVQSLISFAVNEECARSGKSDSGNLCSSYDPLIAAGKPVFHIEYPINKDVSPPQFSSSDRAAMCNVNKGFSTVLKAYSLDCWVMFCDGTIATTNCSPGSGKTRSRGPTSTRPTSKSTKSSTSAPTTTSVVVTTTSTSESSTESTTSIPSTLTTSTTTEEPPPPTTTSTRTTARSTKTTSSKQPTSSPSNPGGAVGVRRSIGISAVGMTGRAVRSALPD